MIYNASGHIGTEYPLSHPRFCFHKWPATVTATNSAPGANPAWLDDGETWSQWKAGESGVSVTLDFGASRAISYVGIAAHTLDLAGSTIALQIDTGSGFANVNGLTGIQPPDDSAILFLLSPVNVTGVRLVVTGSESPAIAVMQAGLAMELPRMAAYTALPISESEQVTLRHTQSVRGQVLGTTVEAAELSFGIDVANLPEDWRAASGVASWKALTAHTRAGKPLFVASRPIGQVQYFDDVAFGVAAERPRFNRAAPNARISGEVSLQLLGYKRP